VSELLLQHLTALLVGFGVTTLLIPRIIKFAHKNAVLDYPNDRRRMHRMPVPRLGGVAIFIGTTAGGAVMIAWGSFSGTIDLPFPTVLPGIIMGATLIFVTGLVDDLRGVQPRGKLIAQALAAGCVVAFGFSIDTVALSTSGSTLNLGLLSIPITIAWIVGMTNAFNLIDGADGLAGTFALIALVTAVGVDLYLHDARSLAITVAMLGAVFAFLRFNHSPARIFLGDAGSMTIGFFLSIRLVIASTTTDGRTIMLVPLFALAFPLVDTAIAIARRWLAGHPFSRADGRHIHHQVLALGIPTRLTVDLLGLFFLAVAALGLSISFAPPRFTLAFMVGTLILLFAAFFYGTRWLRYGEFAELAKSVRSVFRFARTVVREKIRTNEVALQIKTAETFEEVRKLLDGLVDDVRVLDVELVAGDVRAHGPERQQISPPDQLPIRLDYPFVWHSEVGTREVILRLWSERPRHGVHPSTERVATRIGPVLEDWFRRHSRELTPVFGVEAQNLYRKTPVAMRKMDV
jgi:UDP-GlcNAc:undecaprenyl-phosphate GlcNAc-1-phosphate transferase